MRKVAERGVDAVFAVFVGDGDKLAHFDIIIERELVVAHELVQVAVRACKVGVVVIHILVVEREVDMVGVGEHTVAGDEIVLVAVDREVLHTSGVPPGVRKIEINVQRQEEFIGDMRDHPVDRFADQVVIRLIAADLGKQELAGIFGGAGDDGHAVIVVDVIVALAHRVVDCVGYVFLVDGSELHLGVSMTVGGHGEDLYHLSGELVGGVFEFVFPAA